MVAPRKQNTVNPKSELSAILNANRGLKRHAAMFSILVSPSKNDGRQLEFYPPWESQNPIPGKATVELYNTNERPEVTRRLITGDMMHYLGSVDPRNGNVVDPTWFRLKQQLISSLTPEQKKIDESAYSSEAPLYDVPPSQSDWMQMNRGDAYIRGKLTPDARDEWRNMYTPKQLDILEKLRELLVRGSIAPGMNR